jgi:hypothetical protein
MTAIQDGQWTEHYPLSSLDNSAPIEFVIPAQTEKWTDINQCYLYLNVKVFKADGTALEADTETSTVNNFFHSLFSSIDLYLNNKLVTNSSDTYPYRAYIENLLSYSTDSKSTHLRALEMWYPDTAGSMQIKVHDGANEGYKDRRTRIRESRVLEMCGRLHLDVFLQDKYLPNGIEMRVRLNKSTPAFSLFGVEGKIKFEKAGFNVRTVDLLPVMANDLNQTIAQHGMKMPIRRVEVKTFTISQNNQSKIEDHLFHGQLPKRIILGMVKNADMNGSIGTNPFDFQPFGLTKLEVSLDGKTQHNNPFNPDFAAGQCLRSYMSLFQATGSLGMNRSMGLTLEAYKAGYTLWGIDLTADQGSEEGQLHPIKTGNLRIELQFSDPLPDPINVIVYAEFDNQIEINGFREIITDY